MAAPTGLLPASLLTAVAGDIYGNVLPILAAQSWDRLRRQVRERHGWWPVLSGGACGYRTYAKQVQIFNERYTTDFLPGRPVKQWNGRRYYLRPGMATAATPGTSNHGTELGAVDVASLGGFIGQRYREFSAVAVEHGWSNTEGRAIGEAWHWVRNGTDRHHVLTPPPEQVEVEHAPEENDTMRLIQHKDRGIWLTGPGYAHHVTEEELPVALRMYGEPVVFLGNEAGAREFDLARALHTNRTP